MLTPLSLESGGPHSPQAVPREPAGQEAAYRRPSDGSWAGGSALCPAQNRG